MAGSLDTPKVFISYSWNPVLNKQKTMELANRLTSNGINVIIDEWNLSEGQDKFHFMEQMVNDKEIKRVLIICNKDYADKANQKQGGVGVESLIISSDIYSQVEQQKFIPVIFEKDESNRAYTPTFINSRIYIDLSNDEVFEENYEKLLRNIFERPVSKRPPLGNPPAYLMEDEPVYLRTVHLVSGIKKALIEEKQIAQILVEDYYKTFITALEDFQIRDEDIKIGKPIDELVVSKIEAMKALRDDYLNFIEIVFTYSTAFDSDKFVDFFEKVIQFFKNQRVVTGNPYANGAVKHDQYKFFNYEIALYTCVVMGEKEKFEMLAKLLYHDYLVFSENSAEPITYPFAILNKIPESLNKIRNDRLGLRRLSVTADLIKQRADNPKYPFNRLIEWDVLLCYITTLQPTGNYSFFASQWFPHTTVYEILSLPIIQRMVSARHFQKIKVLFNVQTVEELQGKVLEANNKGFDNITRFNYEFPYMNKAFDFARMGKLN